MGYILNRQRQSPGLYGFKYNLIVTEQTLLYIDIDNMWAFWKLDQSHIRSPECWLTLKDISQGYDLSFYTSE